MREKVRRGEQTFSFTADVTEAHRQVPVDTRDWHLLGCQVEAGGDVYINTVGTFGVASASYCWSRVAASVGRITQYISGRSATSWHQLVADDFHLEAGGCRYRAALISFFVLLGKDCWRRRRVAASHLSFSAYRNEDRSGLLVGHRRLWILVQSTSARSRRDSVG